MIRAPFHLAKLNSDTSAGQVASEKWYLCPLRLYRVKLIDTDRILGVGYKVKTLFGYSKPDKQYLGQFLLDAGRFIWRQL